MGRRADSLAEICRDYSIDVLYAFGSRSRQALDWLWERVECMDASSSDPDIGIKSSAASDLDVHALVRLAT